MNIKKLSALVLMIMITAPLATQAAWWNPFDWFQGSVNPVISPREEASSTPDIVPPDPEVVYTDDPALQNRIRTLELENNSLRNENRGLKTTITSLTASLERLSNQVASLKASDGSVPVATTTSTGSISDDVELDLTKMCDQARSNYLTEQEALRTIEVWYQEADAAYKKQYGVLMTSEPLQREYYSRLNPQRVRADRAGTEFTAYCK